MRTKLLTTLAALLTFAACSGAVGADNSPVGLWQATNPDTQQPSGWFAVTEHNGVYVGTLVKMFLQPGQDPKIQCKKCTGDRHDKPWLGLQIIRGMQQKGPDRYGGGTILDPRDGDVYDAMMKVSPDGQTLIVRGYLGFSFLGRNEYWTRLPDTDYQQLDPAIRAELAASASGSSL